MKLLKAVQMYSTPVDAVLVRVLALHWYPAEVALECAAGPAEISVGLVKHTSLTDRIELIRDPGPDPLGPLWLAVTRQALPSPDLVVVRLVIPLSRVFYVNRLPECLEVEGRRGEL